MSSFLSLSGKKLMPRAGDPIKYCGVEKAASLCRSLAA
jgi:hypothetical protein